MSHSRSVRPYIGAVVFVLFLGGAVGFAFDSSTTFNTRISEPAVLTLLGAGFIAVTAAYRRRREGR